MDFSVNEMVQGPCAHLWSMSVNTIQIFGKLTLIPPPLHIEKNYPVHYLNQGISKSLGLGLHCTIHALVYGCGVNK